MVTLREGPASPAFTVTYTGCGAAGTSDPATVTWGGISVMLEDGQHHRRLDYVLPPNVTGEFHMITHVEQVERNHDPGWLLGVSSGARGARLRAIAPSNA